MRVFTSVDEFAAVVGEPLGVSAWRTISQTDIDNFAAATGDHQWIHVDPVRAATGPFGTTIAHGYLTLALVAVFEEEIFTVEAIDMAINYGSNKIRFIEPVPVGSRVRMRAELLSADPSANGLRTVIKATIEIDGKAKPACVAEVMTVYVPLTERPSG